MKEENLERKIEMLEKTLSVKKNPDTFLELALLYDKVERFFEAYRKFEQVIKIYPNYLKAHLFRIAFLCKWGKKENFFDMVEKYFYIKFFNEVPMEFLVNDEDIRRGYDLITDVIQASEKVISFSRDSIIDWSIKAFFLSLLDKKESELIFSTILSKFSDNLRVQLLYVLICIDDQSYHSAVNHLKRIIESNPLFDDAYILLGYIYLKQHIFVQGINNLKKAMEINPRKIIPILLLAKNLILMGKYDEAIDILQNRGLTIEPSNFEIIYYLAQAYKGKNDYEEASKLYSKLIQMGYSGWEIKKEAAQVLTLLGEYKEAVSLLLEVKQDLPIFDQEVYENLIVINERIGNLDEAFNLAKEAISIQEKYDLLKIGAKIAFRKGDFSTAYTWYRKILERNSKDFEALYYLGIIELSRMRFGISEKYFEEASCIDPTKNEIKYFLALNYAFQDKIQNAIDILVKVKDSLKDSIKSKIISFNIAAAYSILGNVDKTEQFLYEAILDFTNHLRNISEQDIIFFTTLLFQTRVVYEASKSNKELEESQSQMIQAMIDAIQAKDNYTKDHTKRVTVISVEIAKAMKLEEEIIQALLIGTLVHDIGKIGIPDNILNKPGRLDEQEFQIMKQHTTIGYEIVRKMKFPKIRQITSNDRFTNIGTIADCVRYHHEKWDGTGYPDGLKGEQIPLLARIIAVADVFDALMSERQYKKGLPAFKSIKIIEESSGTHFDPMVVEYFLKIVDDLVILLYTGSKGTREYFDRSVEELLKMSKEDILGDIGRY
ncbi:MAG: HD domain-containing phosphohydrolase [bacterium]